MTVYEVVRDGKWIGMQPQIVTFLKGHNVDPDLVGMGGLNPEGYWGFTRDGSGVKIHNDDSLVREFRKWPSAAIWPYLKQTVNLIEDGESYDR